LIDIDTLPVNPAFTGPRRDSLTMRLAARAKSFKGTALYEHLTGRIRSKVSHSQFGEDVYLSSYFDRLSFERNVRVQSGCVVDIGAFRPIMSSNSYFFYKRRWQGINIDPTPGFKSCFDRVRPRDINIEAAIAPTGSMATFHLFGWPSVWNTLDPDAAAQAAKLTGLKPSLVPVAVSRLDALLDRHLNGRPLEAMLIDAEGYDVEILRSNDFNKHRPRVIIIEVMNASAETLSRSPVVEHLAAYGYRLHAWLNPSLMLVREDSLLQG